MAATTSQLLTRTRLALGLMVLLVLAGTLMPGSLKHQLLSPFPAQLHVDKLGHMLGFLAMAFVAARARFRKVSGWQVIALALALAAFTELCQNFIPGRTPRVADVFIDLAGACLGVWSSTRVSAWR